MGRALPNALSIFVRKACQQMNGQTSRQAEIPIESRLKHRLPEASGGKYIGQRMVKLTVEEVEEVISTISGLRTQVGVVPKSNRGGVPDR
jgi:hypothetical protein